MVEASEKVKFIEALSTGCPVVFPSYVLVVVSMSRSLRPSDSLILCGLKIPNDNFGFDGFSDGNIRQVTLPLL